MNGGKGDRLKQRRRNEEKREGWKEVNGKKEGRTYQEIKTKK